MEAKLEQVCRGDVVEHLSGTGAAYLVYTAMGLRAGAESQDKASAGDGLAACGHEVDNNTVNTNSDDNVNRPGQSPGPGQSHSPSPGPSLRQSPGQSHSPSPGPSPGLRQSPGQSHSPSPGSCRGSSGELDAHHLQTLLSILKQSPDSAATALLRTGVCRLASVSGNRDLLRSQGGIGVIAESLRHPLTHIKVQALNALNALFDHAANRETIQETTQQVCELVCAQGPDSQLRLAALRLLGNLSQCRQNQLRMRRSIPELLRLLHRGPAQTRSQVLEVCLNLSTNHELTFDILNTRAPPAFLSAFNLCSPPDLLKGHLTFLSNVNEIRRSPQYAASHREYNEESLCALLFTGSHFSNKLFPLMTHPDSGVYLLTAKILTKLRS